MPRKDGEGNPIPDAKPIWTGRAATSLDDAVGIIRWASGLSDTRDFYVCMSRQALCEDKVSKAGRPYRRALRDAEHAMALKSFFLDLDVKEGAYATTKEAVAALGKFRRAIDLPPPTFVVASGSGGFHAHWVCSDPVASHEWLEQAHKLVAAVKQHGLLCDTQCSVDAARVLRIPDTKNWKHTPPKDVAFLLPPGEEYTFERIKRALAPFDGGVHPVAPILPPRPALVGVSDLAAGIEVTQAPPVKLEDVMPQCAFINEAVTTGGAAFDNPMWNLTTLIATFTEGKRADAHRMAAGHADYTPETTDELFDRKEAERERKDLGWPQCSSIAVGYSGCNACPHKAAGKSPLNHRTKPVLTLVHSTAQPFKALNDLPPGYLRDSDGVVLALVEQEDGSNAKVPVAPYSLTEGWIQRDPWAFNFKVGVNDDIVVRVSVPYDLLSARDLFFRHIASQGVTLQDRYQKHFREFIMSWVDQLRKGKNAIIATQPFGWVVEHGRVAGFSYGGTVFMPGGEEKPAANPNPVFQQIYRVAGEREPWIEAAKMITNQKRPGLNLILASAFAAPLVRFTGENGMLISVFSSDSGIGKSTAISVAQSVWADPVRAKQGLTDTSNSTVDKIGALKNLPVYWDELKAEEDRRRFVNIIFQLSQGKGKSRLDARAQQREVGTWETMMLSASNESIVEYAARQTKSTSAGVVRILEYTLERGTEGQIEGTKASLMVNKLKDNYGQIGAEYAKFLGENHQRVALEMEMLSIRLGEKLKIDGEERFWRACATAIIQGAIYANEIGATEFDVDALEDYMCKTIEGMRVERDNTGSDMSKRINVSNVLSKYLDAMRARHTLWTNHIHIAKGKPQAGAVRVMRSADRLDGLFVQVGLDDALLRMVESNLREWLVEHGYSTMVFLKALEKEFGYHRLPGRIGSGTDYVTGTQYLLQIQLAGTPLAEIAAKDGGEGDEEDAA